MRFLAGRLALAQIAAHFRREICIYFSSDFCAPFCLRRFATTLLCDN